MSKMIWWFPEERLCFERHAVIRIGMICLQVFFVLNGKNCWMMHCVTWHFSVYTTRDSVHQQRAVSTKSLHCSRIEWLTIELLEWNWVMGGLSRNVCKTLKPLRVLSSRVQVFFRKGFLVVCCCFYSCWKSHVGPCVLLSKSFPFCPIP